MMGKFDPLYLAQAVNENTKKDLSPVDNRVSVKTHNEVCSKLATLLQKVQMSNMEKIEAPET